METVILIFELIGTISFSLSGSLCAIAKKLDMFGILFCGVVTALGGGVFRDIMLGSLPPTMFTDGIYVIFALTASIITFLVVKFNKKEEHESKKLKRLNYIIDAIGLAVFTVVGINVSITHGFGDNAFFVIFLGMTTGCGGGIFRDIMLNEIPSVFTKFIYAIASLIGGGIYYFVLKGGFLSDTIAMTVSILIIFFIRLAAMIFKLNLPKAE